VPWVGNEVSQSNRVTAAPHALFAQQVHEVFELLQPVGGRIRAAPASVRVPARESGRSSSEARIISASVWISVQSNCSTSPPTCGLWDSNSSPSACRPARHKVNWSPLKSPQPRCAKDRCIVPHDRRHKPPVQVKNTPNRIIRSRLFLLGLPNQTHPLRATPLRSEPRARRNIRTLLPRGRGIDIAHLENGRFDRTSRGAGAHSIAGQPIPAWPNCSRRPLRAPTCFETF